jgi:hypothetical protein
LVQPSFGIEMWTKGKKQTVHLVLIHMQFLNFKNFRNVGLFFVYNFLLFLHVSDRIGTINFIAFPIGKNVFLHYRYFYVAVILTWWPGAWQVVWNGDKLGHVWEASSFDFWHDCGCHDWDLTWFYSVPLGKYQASASNWNWNCSMSASFNVLSSSLFANNSAVLCYLLWVTDSIVK